jgi:hypothetical protein
MSVVVDEQGSPAGHLLPPEPRQPGTQRDEAGSQTRPEVGPPQSLSCVQPHLPPGRHSRPARSAPQFWVSVVVHSRQVCVTPSQSIGAGQSVSPRQPTQRAAPVSHLGNGVLQSLSEAQPVGAMHWSALPALVEQLWPAGQPLRGAGPQPG